MRIAIHFPPDHPNSPGAVAAYRLGRVEDGVHNVNMLTQEVTPLEETIPAVIEQAKRDFPDCEIVLERMVMHPDGDKDESIWIPVEEFDAEVHTPTRQGNSLAPIELSSVVQATPEVRKSVRRTGGSR